MLRWMGRIFGGLIGLVVVLALAGASYQAIATALDTRKYPPPGKLVDVGGYRLHLNCTGVDSPPVIMDALAGGSSLSWSLVQPAVAQFTRVCSYDRAGLGWSDAGPTPRAGQQMVDELHRLLLNADIAGAYVLVGHSLGGFTVRLYARQYPAEVVGMVLVDAGHEDEFGHAEFRHYMDVTARPLPVARIAARFGVMRLAGVLGLIPTPGTLPNLPPEVGTVIDAVSSPTRFWTALSDEATAVEETTVQVRVTGSLGDMPLVVLTATGPTWMPWLPPDFPMFQFKQMWMHLQKDLTKLSSNSTQILAEKSSHFIPYDEPELVINAIRQVVAAARQRQDTGHLGT